MTYGMEQAAGEAISVDYERKWDIIRGAFDLPSAGMSIAGICTG
jgi:hypothetical protein